MKILNRYTLSFLILLFPSLLFASPPSSSYTYTAGQTIQPSEVQQNETNIYNYLSTGVDTYADSTIISADITDETITTSDILNGTIVNADISSSAAIDASKIADGTVSSTEFQYINSLSSNAQTQIANILSGTTSFSGLTASSDLDIGTYELRANTLESDVATGTAPLTVASTTKITNLNADTTDGYEGGRGIPTNIQVFTSTGTWTKPAGVSTVYVKVWGGGGGGQGGSTGSGSGGGYSEGLIAVSGNVSVTVGAGGTGGGTGANGETSSFAGDTTIQATGGQGPGTGYTPGVGSNGSVNLTGQAGKSGLSDGGFGAVGGSGGMTAAAGVAGVVPGGGGGCASNLDASGSGAAGMVIVYY